MKFFGRDVALRFTVHAQQAEDECARAVEQPDERGRCLGKPDHRQRHCRGNRFGCAQGELFGDKLADDQRQKRRDTNDDRKAKRFSGFGFDAQLRDTFAGRSAEAGPRIGAGDNADQRNADLDRGQKAPGVCSKFDGNACAGFAAPRHCFEPRFARRDNGKLGHRKDAIQCDEREDDRNISPGIGSQGKWSHGAPLCLAGFCRLHNRRIMRGSSRMRNKSLNSSVNRCKSQGRLS